MTLFRRKLRRVWHRWGRPSPTACARARCALMSLGPPHRGYFTAGRCDHWWFALVGDYVVWSRTRFGLSVRAAGEERRQAWQRIIMEGSR